MNDMSGCAKSAGGKPKKREERDRIKKHIETHGVDRTDVDLAELLETRKYMVQRIRREMGLKSYWDAKREALVNDPDFATAPTSVLAARHGYSPSTIQILREANKPERYAHAPSAWINPMLRKWAEFHAMATGR